MKRLIWTFGLTAALLLVSFQLGKFSLLTGSLPVEGVLGGIALLFAGLGMLIGRQNRRRSTPVVETGPALKDRSQVAGRLGISPRELEVLDELAQGLSNREIAQKLFVTESTVKTHVSNLLQKLTARRRTEAVRKAREKGLV